MWFLIILCKIKHALKHISFKLNTHLSLNHVMRNVADNSYKLKKFNTFSIITKNKKKVNFVKSLNQFFLCKSFNLFIYFKKKLHYMIDKHNIYFIIYAFNFITNVNLLIS